MKIRWLVQVSCMIALMFWSGLGWAQQPKPGGTLRMALAGDLTFFNANQGPAPGYFTFWVWNNIFNSLLTLTPPPELKIVPELATSWEVLDGGKTYIFHLVISFAVLDNPEFLYLLELLDQTSFFGTPWGTQEHPRYRCNWLNTQHVSDAEEKVMRIKTGGCAGFDPAETHVEPFNIRPEKRETNE